MLDKVRGTSQTREVEEESYEDWKIRMQKSKEAEEESYKKFDTCRHGGLKPQVIGMEIYDFPYCKKRGWGGLSFSEIPTEDSSDVTFFESEFQPSVTCGKCSEYKNKKENNEK